jgi:hypothetical protein
MPMAAPGAMPLTPTDAGVRRTGDAYGRPRDSINFLGQRQGHRSAASGSYELGPGLQYGISLRAGLGCGQGRWAATVDGNAAALKRRKFRHHRITAFRL